MDTRQTILNACLDLLEIANWNDIKTARIAARAGVAEGTLYNYFSSKQELIIEAVGLASRELAKTVFHGLGEEHTIRENLTRLARNFLLSQGQTGSLYRIIYKAFSEVENPAIRQVLSDLYPNGIRMVEELILKSRDADELRIPPARMKWVVMMLWGLGDSLWKSAVVSGQKPVTETEVESLVNTLYRMMSGME